jgi:hypothetical protein
MRCTCHRDGTSLLAWSDALYPHRGRLSVVFCHRGDSPLQSRICSASSCDTSP